MLTQAALARTPSALLLAALPASVLLAYGLAAAPLAAAGAGFGFGILILSVVRPTVVLGIMFALGPIDLSWVTGGFKALFPELGGLDMNGIRLIAITAGLGTLVVTDSRVTARLLTRPARWYLVFLAFASATLLFSPAPLDGLRLLLKLAYPFLVFVTVLGVVEDEKELERLVDVTLLAAAVIACVLVPVLGLAGAYSTDMWGHISLQTDFHKNPFSFYMLAMLLLAVIRFAVRRELRYLLLGGIFAAWIVLAVTRITLLASLAALAGVALYSAIAERNYRALAGALMLGLLVAIPLTPMALERTFWGNIPSARELLDLLRDPVTLYHTINWQGREIFWAFLLAAFLQSPLVGLGLGASSALLGTNFPATFGLVAHNEYIRLLTDTGVIGALLYALAVSSWFVAVVRAGSTRHAGVKEFAIPAAALIIAWALIAATDNPFDYYAPFTQYIAFLCASALVYRELADRSRASQAPSPP